MEWADAEWWLFLHACTLGAVVADLVRISGISEVQCYGRDGVSRSHSVPLFKKRADITHINLLTEMKCNDMVKYSYFNYWKEMH